MQKQKGCCKLEDMESTTEKDNLSKSLRVGEIVEGFVIGRGRSAVYLDLAPFGTGIIYGREFFGSKEQLKKLQPGQNIFVKITDLENEDGYIELSVGEASKDMGWDFLRKKKESDEEITVKILGANKGGLIADVSGIQAFLPVSQLAPEHYPRVEGGDTTKILKELQKFIGQELKVKIFDVAPREGKLILSEKLKELEKTREILKNYKVGDVIEREITGVTDFGAFVKFPLSSGGSAKEEALEGLIHISEIDWAIIEDPAEVVKIGEKVKVKIIEINNDKVSLSLKALKKDPWQDVEKKYKKGDNISGKVTKLNPFGAFIQITDKIQGLCHISEFGTKTKMEEKIILEKSYDFEILEIKPEEHRMSLKLIEK